jgi:hypothetical protein
MASAQTTRDHETIRRWAEERGGVPAIVKGTEGLLRIDFAEPPSADGPDDSLEQTTWDRWFQIFDENNLAFLYDPEPESRFFKLVSAETANAAEGGGGRKASGTRRTSRSRRKPA